MYRYMFSLLVVTAVSIGTSACTSSEQRTAGYGVGGAAIGAAAGTLVGVAQTRNGVQYCRYRDQHGRVFEAPCR